MKRILIALLFVTLSVGAFGQSSVPIKAREADGSPSTSMLTELVFPNNTLARVNGKITYTPAGSGTVTSVSVSTANGISGSVANPTTTPAITLNITALDAAKIADGSVSNTEFQFIGTLGSNAQTQLDAKAPVASPTFTTSATAPTIYGGSAIGSVLTLAGTSNGSPVASYINIPTSVRLQSSASGASVPSSGSGVEIAYYSDLGYGQLLAFDRTGGTFLPFRFSGSTIDFRPNGTLRLTVATDITFAANLIASSDNTFDIGASGATRPRTGYFGTSVNSPTYFTTTNCSDSAGAAACGSAAAGSVVIDAAATTVVVSSTAVTANSQILAVFDSSLGTRLGITCNTTIALPAITARTAGTSFTIAVAVAPITNPACYSYTIVN